MRGVLQLMTFGSAGMFALLVPAIMAAIANGENDMIRPMLVFAFIGVFLTVVILASISGGRESSDRAFRYLSLVATWLTVSFLAALSFMVLADIGFSAALFEAVSALTTSGGSVLDKENAALSLLFWRTLLEWYGGFLTLSSIVLVLAPAGFGGLQSRAGSLLVDKPEAGLYSLTAYGSLMMQYGLVTMAILLGLLLFGVAPLEAVMLGMIASATGGFVPFIGGIEAHIGNGAMTVLGFGLCLGTLSIFWRRALLRRPGRIFQNSLETKIVVLAISLVSVVYAARIVGVTGNETAPEIFKALEEGFFAASSLVATSGMESRPGVIALLPNIVVLAIIFVGGGVYSTSGGVKIFRIGAMWIYAIAELNRLIYPNSVARMRFGEATIDTASIQAIWSYFIIAVLIIGAGSVLISLSGTNFEAAIIMAVSLFSNAGPVYEALRPVSASADGVWPLYSSLPGAVTYLIGAIIMFIGRLEVLVVFAVFNIRYWYYR